MMQKYLFQNLHDLRGIAANSPIGKYSIVKMAPVNFSPQI
jgi:hypothetical protein